MAERKANDNYPTPAPLARLGWQIAQRYVAGRTRLDVCEPGCGDAQPFLWAATGSDPRVVGLDGCDVRPVQAQHALFRVAQRDWTLPDAEGDPGPWDVIITNPPFSITEAFARRALGAAGARRRAGAADPAVVPGLGGAARLLGGAPAHGVGGDPAAPELHGGRRLRHQRVRVLHVGARGGAGADHHLGRLGQAQGGAAAARPGPGGGSGVIPVDTALGCVKQVGRVREGRGQEERMDQVIEGCELRSRAEAQGEGR